MKRTTLYPVIQFKENTWEIDEFDIASVFLLIGTEKALLIDTGIGIGDLKAAVRNITNKPLIVVLTHNHPDHTGNAGQFQEIWLNPKDLTLEPIPGNYERRKEDINLIRLRQHGGIGQGMFGAFNLYAYDLERDLSEGSSVSVIRELHDGQTFDLGGGRVVKAYEAAGHSPGHMIFLDEQSRSLFCGDALNFNLSLGGAPIEDSLTYLENMQALGDRYDGIYNGHHDFRALGEALRGDCLPDAIDLCRQIRNKAATPVTVPSFWGAASGRPARTMYIKGRTFISYPVKLSKETEEPAC